MKHIIGILVILLLNFTIAEDIVLKNGYIIRGNIVELSDDGIKVEYSRTGSFVVFAWDELEENFAKKIYFNLFRREFDTKNYVLGVEIKKYKSDKIIKGVYIKKFSTKDSIYVKTKGKLIKLNRNTIEYIKPTGISIFEIFSENEIYIDALKKILGHNRKSDHKKVLSKLRGRNMNIYKLHLMLYLMSKFETIKSYKLYKVFDKLLKKAVERKDLCVLDYLVKKNWQMITFYHLYSRLVYLATKCNYKTIRDSIDKFSDQELIVYSTFFYNLINLYILSFSYQPIKELDSIVGKEFNSRIKDLGILFKKDKKDIYELWNKRNLNFVKMNACNITNNKKNFYRRWDKVQYKKRYLIMVGAFIDKYLRVIGRTPTTVYSNLQCFEYVVK